MRIAAEALSFDDILLVPQTSFVASRSDVDLKMSIGDLPLKLPIISSPMDTITQASMSAAMRNAGGLGIVHRYQTISDQCDEVFVVGKGGKSGAAAAVGATGDYLERAKKVVRAGAYVILVDVANGHSSLASAAVYALRREFGADIHIMAGNVSTPEGYLKLADAGAESVRVGIGGGSVCTTRIVTGHGIPTLQSLIDIQAYRKRDGNPLVPSVIADGGIRNSGDMVKAFAAGADAVMVGSLLAGTDKSPGEVIGGIGGELKVKVFRGMASKEANEWRGGVKIAEGVSTTVPYKGSVVDVLNELRLGIASGCSYSGVDKLSELADKAVARRVTQNGVAESRPHAKGN